MFGYSKIVIVIVIILFFLMIYVTKNYKEYFSARSRSKAYTPDASLEYSPETGEFIQMKSTATKYPNRFLNIKNYNSAASNTNKSVVVEVKEIKQGVVGTETNQTITGTDQYKWDNDNKEKYTEMIKPNINDDNTADLIINKLSRQEFEDSQFYPINSVVQLIDVPTDQVGPKTPTNYIN